LSETCILIRLLQIIFHGTGNMARIFQNFGTWQLAEHWSGSGYQIQMALTLNWWCFYSVWPLEYLSKKLLVPKKRASVRLFNVKLCNALLIVVRFCVRAVSWTITVVCYIQFLCEAWTSSHYSTRRRIITYLVLLVRCIIDFR
jgi:hypothetical protein